MLFLGLVALAIVIIEALPAPGPRDGAAGLAPFSASASDAGQDLLVLRFGLTPDPRRVPVPAQSAPRQPSATDTHATEAAPTAPRPTAIDDPDDYHVVGRGETLSGIARDRLGSARLAGELARLNGLPDADNLREGQVLRLR